METIMMDMGPVIEPKSDQLNSDSLMAGPISVTITAVSIRPGTEQPISISYDGDDGKPWKPCKSMSRVLVAAWGPDAKAYTGRSLTLYRDPKVKWGGMEVGGIRISHMSDIAKPMVLALTETRANRKPYTVQPMKDAPKQQSPAQQPSPPVEPLSETLTTYAVWLEDTIRGMTAADLKPFWEEEIAKPEWSDLKSADPDRARGIHSAVSSKLKGAGDD